MADAACAPKLSFYADCYQQAERLVFYTCVRMCARTCVFVRNCVWTRACVCVCVRARFILIAGSLILPGWCVGLHPNSIPRNVWRACVRFCHGNRLYGLKVKTSTSSVGGRGSHHGRNMPLTTVGSLVTTLQRYLALWRRCWNWLARCQHTVTRKSATSVSVY